MASENAPVTFGLFCLGPFKMSFHWPVTEKIMGRDVNTPWALGSLLYSSWMRSLSDFQSRDGLKGPSATGSTWRMITQLRTQARACSQLLVETMSSPPLEELCPKEWTRTVGCSCSQETWFVPHHPRPPAALDLFMWGTVMDRRGSMVKVRVGGLWGSIGLPITNIDLLSPKLKEYNPFS